MLFRKNSRKAQFREDMDIVCRIVYGDEQAWKDFVVHYTDWVSFKANQWSQRPDAVSMRANRRNMNNRKNGKEHTFTEESLDAYIWIFEQLKKKLQYYKGMAKLSTYIWAILNKNQFFVDYLRWKYGDARKIPKVLQDATEREQKIFIRMRERKSIEQIASELELSINEAETIARNVIERLVKAGLEDMVFPAIEVECREDELNGNAGSSNGCEAEWILRFEILPAYQNAVVELASDEILLLRLFYNVELKADEVLKNYAAADMELPGGKYPNEIQTREVYKIKGKVEKKLLELFRKRCEHLEVIINDNTLRIFLDQIGVEVEQ